MTDRRSYLWISDLEGTQLDTIRSSSALEFSIDERLDQSEVLRITIPADHPKAYLLEPDREIRWKDRRFSIGEVEDERSGSQVTQSVEAEATWYELGRDTVPGTFLLDDVTPAAGLATILEDTGWNAGGSTSADSTTFSLEVDDRSPLEILRTWAKITGTFLRFEPAGRTVNLLAESGADLGLGFRYRRNVRSVRRRVRPPAVTRLYAYGADGLVLPAYYVEDLSYYTSKGVDLDAIGPDGRANRERLTRSIVLVDTSFTDQADLLAWANTKIAELAQPIVSYEMDVVDLSELTGIAETVRVGDTVRVYDPAFSTNVRTTVVRYVRFPDDPSRNRVELAYLPTPLEDPSQSVGRGAGGEEWIQFVGPVVANFQIRNDAVWTVGRIPLRFREGGRFHTSIDVPMTGVGAGTATVEIYDATDDEVVFTRDVAYTDGDVSRVAGTFARENMTGTHDFRLRISTTADGGPSSSNGLDLVYQDPESDEISWWMMVQRAVREAPPLGEESQTFTASNEIQEFTVPDNVTEIAIVATGAPGGGKGGAGGRVTAEGFVVTPGETLQVLAGAVGQSPAIHTPLGGRASAGPGNDADSGGGVSGVFRNVSDLADFATLDDSNILIVAGGGGGGGRGGSLGIGGDAGFILGSDGEQGAGGTAGSGATQSAGGAQGGGVGVGDGSDGDRFYGGVYATSSSTSDSGGAGGVGYYGGGAGGGASAQNEGAGGGGGSGYLDPAAILIIAEDGANTGDATVVISWTAPDLG